jgi:hypothetical protein
MPVRSCCILINFSRAGLCLLLAWGKREKNMRSGATRTGLKPGQQAVTSEQLLNLSESPVIHLQTGEANDPSLWGHLVKWQEVLPCPAS